MNQGPKHIRSCLQCKELDVILEGKEFNFLLCGLIYERVTTNVE